MTEDNPAATSAWWSRTFLALGAVLGTAIGRSAALAVAVAHRVQAAILAHEAGPTDDVADPTWPAGRVPGA